jgi:hypothetical protein
VIVAGPGPLYGVAGLNGHGAGTVVRTALSHGNIRSRCESNDWEEKNEKGDQPEMHFEGENYSKAIFDPQIRADDRGPSIRTSKGRGYRRTGPNRQT